MSSSRLAYPAAAHVIPTATFGQFGQLAAVCAAHPFQRVSAARVEANVSGLMQKVSLLSSLLGMLVAFEPARNPFAEQSNPAETSFVFRRTDNSPEQSAPVISGYSAPRAPSSPPSAVENSGWRFAPAQTR
jgi:hypothetical protein